jgi:hypothetical protein
MPRRYIGCDCHFCKISHHHFNEDSPFRNV